MSWAGDYVSKTDRKHRYWKRTEGSGWKQRGRCHRYSVGVFLYLHVAQSPKCNRCDEIQYIVVVTVEYGVVK
jgi:hypothetical protein